MAEATETPESTNEEAKAAAGAEVAKESKAEALAAAAKMPKDGGSADSSGEDSDKPEITDKVVFINRCAKVVKGGRRFSFSALVVAGNQRGKVGYGFGKANEVAEAIRKASELAKRSLVDINLTENTITHEVLGVHGGGKVLLRPAVPGTGIIAGGGVRAVCEAVGIHDLLGKSLGSKNPANVVKATIEALRSLRTKDEIYRLRGRKSADKKAI